MDSGFGARLRAHREQQQVALADIAEQTKIKVSLLAALERDDVSQWPSGIFRRSYIRAYARAIGLEPDAVVREFLERYPDPEEAAAVLEALDDVTTKRRPPTRLRFLIASAIEALPVLRPSHAPAKAPAISAAPGTLSGPDDVGPFLAVPPVPLMAAADEWEADTVCVSSSEAVDEHPLSTPAAAPAPVTEAAAPVSTRDAVAELAGLCGRLARIADPSELGPAFEEATRLLEAQGVILWMWDPQASALRPVIGHGYPQDLLTRLEGVSRDDDNAIAAAFRTCETQQVNGRSEETGAVVVPMITSTGCTGVLAFELPGGREPAAVVRAFAAIIAAQIATLIT
jgi:transcriptional regulator with XRE-family HTH domain